MTRPATPTNILEMRGAYEKNPQRRKDRKNEPEISPIKGIPRTLNADEKKIWKEIVARVHEGVIGDSDAIALETLTRLVYRMRFDFDGMSAAHLGQMVVLFGRFGMTPSDRTKIVVKKKEDNQDPWADL